MPEPAGQPTVYTLKLTEQDLDTIHFVSDRYCWSGELSKHAHEAGDLALTEEDLCNICEQFEADTEGGHSFFPMLDPGSLLFRKLADMFTAWEESYRDG